MLLTLKVARKLTDIGIMMKYPNNTPRKNKIDEMKMKNFALRRSFSYNAGLMKPQSRYKMYGNETMKPPRIQIQMNILIWPSICVFWMMNGNSVMQMLSANPSWCDKSQK